MCMTRDSRTAQACRSPITDDPAASMAAGDMSMDEIESRSVLELLTRYAEQAYINRNRRGLGRLPIAQIQTRLLERQQTTRGEQ